MANKVKFGLSNVHVLFIEKYDANQYSPIYVDNDQIVQIYLNEYKNNILFDMALYKLDQMIAEMKFNRTYDPYTVLTVPRIRAQIQLTDKYDPQFRTKK